MLLSLPAGLSAEVAQWLLLSTGIPVGLFWETSGKVGFAPLHAPAPIAFLIDSECAQVVSPLAVEVVWVDQVRVELVVRAECNLWALPKASSPRYVSTSFAGFVRVSLT